MKVLIPIMCLVKQLIFINVHGSNNKTLQNSLGNKLNDAAFNDACLFYL